MNCETLIEQIKQTPGYADNVGMILVHNGTVRSWSRKGHKTVTAVKVTPDNEKIQAICQQFQQKPGIFRVLAHAHQGLLQPGDNLLHLAIAGDIRENVLTAFTALLDTIKSEAVFKEELFE